MKVQSLVGILVVVLACLVVLLACGSPTSPVTSPAEAPQAPAPATQLPASSAGQAVSDTGKSGSSDLIWQWASETEASSQYGDPDWSASQATGAPDTLNCGDVRTAWASANSDSLEWINLYFETAVYPTEIHVIETYYPDQVARVELIDMEGRFASVYTGQPSQVERPCPYTLSIDVSEDATLVQGVRITIDQSVLQNWNEIDAVAIVGVPGEGTPVRPSKP